MKTLVSGLAITVLCAGIMVGQASNNAEEKRKAILEYSLTMAKANQLLAALDAMTKYVVTLPDFADRVKKSTQMTLAEQASQIDKDPKAAEIVKKNQLSAKDYVVGVPVLRMALLAAGGTPQGPTVIVSPANLAFAKANYSTLKPKMDAADGTGSRR